MGQGYVGLPMALRAAETGIEVVGFDTNPVVAEALLAGRSHIGDISDEDLARGLAAGYTATSDPECLTEADVIIVVRADPARRGGGPDLGAVRGAASMIGERVRPGTLCVLESTTYPGTTEEVFAPPRLSRSA